MARDRGLTVAVAESLTGGLLANRMARTPEASEWFAGGVVAYTPSTKVRVLGCTPGPVITERTACEMAQGVAKVLGADVAASTTGVGGPDAAEGHPPGTVWIGVYADGAVDACLFRFTGDPEEVVQQACDAAIHRLQRALQTH
jgi:nicotinamide-nucleotide amidase